MSPQEKQAAAQLSLDLQELLDMNPEGISKLFEKYNYANVPATPENLATIILAEVDSDFVSDLYDTAHGKLLVGYDYVVDGVHYDNADDANAAMGNTVKTTAADTTGKNSFMSWMGKNGGALVNVGLGLLGNYLNKGNPNVNQYPVTDPRSPYYQKPKTNTVFIVVGVVVVIALIAVLAFSKKEKR